MIEHYYIFLTVQDDLSQIEEMPEFFRQAVEWGITASYKVMGFLVLMALSINLFKK